MFTIATAEANHKLSPTIRHHGKDDVVVLSGKDIWVGDQLIEDTDVLVTLEGYSPGYYPKCLAIAYEPIHGPGYEGASIYVWIEAPSPDHRNHLWLLMDESHRQWEALFVEAQENYLGGL